MVKLEDHVAPSAVQRYQASSPTASPKLFVKGSTAWCSCPMVATAKFVVTTCALCPRAPY